MSRVWHSMDTMPERRLVLVRLRDELKPFDGPSVWCHWRDGNRMFGDHYSSWRGTERSLGEGIEWSELDV